MTTTLQKRNDAIAAMESRGKDAAENLKWRFKSRQDQIKAVAWLCGSYFDPNNQKAFSEWAYVCNVIVREMRLKWWESPLGGESLIPTEWSTQGLHYDSDEERYYQLDGAGNKTWLGWGELK